MSMPQRKRAQPDRPGRTLVVCLATSIFLFWAGAEPPAAAELYPTLDWRLVLLAAMIGAIPVLSYPIGYRTAGFVPLGLTIFVGGFWIGYRISDGGMVSSFGLGVWLGGTIRYFARAYRLRHRQRDREALKIDSLPLTGLLLVYCVTGLSCPVHGDFIQSPTLSLLCWVALLVFAWVRLFREFFELCVEPFVCVGYRLRGRGPGLTAVPYHGPLIVMANHACWWDPLFLAKLLPRPVTPMMTSVFFDIWFLRPLMTYVFRTIRVPDGTVRRTTPEIDEAIRALDEGKFLVIFPEGYLRRREDLPLRRFGRGIWEILRARPDTPVVCCWIEGNWGCWASFYGGPPTKNKSLDFRRRIDVGMSAPITILADVLADHMTTRIALMNEVNDARKHIGLLPFPSYTLPEAGAEAESSE